MVKMKILHIIPNLRKGGAERLALDICIELNKRDNIEVCLIALSDKNDYSFLSKQINYTVIPSTYIPSITGKATVKTDDLHDFIRSFKPDIIHTHLFEADLVARQQIYKGAIYFSHCHDNMHQLRSFSISDLKSKTRIAELYEKKLIIKQYKACNNQFIAISNHTKEYFEQSLPNSLQKNITLLHNAIDYSRFSKSSPQTEELTLINIGSFVTKKNQQLLIPIIKQLISEGINCKAILLGDGPLRNDFIQQIKTEGIEQYFNLPGNVPDVENWLSQSSIYVHTALYEPLGLVLLEAMAAKLPVVALNGGGNADLMVEGENGYLINNPDVELFIDKIKQLWKNKNLYQEISKNAGDFAKAFDIQNYAEQLISLYRR